MTLTDFTRRYGVDDLEQYLDPAPEPPQPRSVDRVPYIGPDRPGDAYDATHTGHDVLAVLGFHSPADRGGDTHYVRSGKTSRDGYSAVVYNDGHTTIYSETCGQWWPGLKIRWGYSPFYLYAAVFHRNDISAASRELRAKGYGTPYQPDTLEWAITPPVDVIDVREVSDERTAEPDHGWLPVDAATILADDYEPPRPTLLERTDGAALFYTGRINGLFGESGSGKSWLALLTAAQQIELGHHALYVDLEDHADSVYGRLMAIGITKTQIVEQFTYISPNIPWNDAAAAWTAKRIREHSMTLVVIDSTGESMALDGAKPNDDDATASWFRRLPRFLAHLGACVVLVDHQPKSTEGGPSEIGSQRKRAAIDGATYHVSAPVSPARGVDGVLKVMCKKDRNGTYAKGQIVADVDVTSNKAGTKVQITVRRHEKLTRPTVLMGRISEHLDAVGPEGTSQRALFAAVSGKTEGKKIALTALIDEGYVKQNTNGGNRGFIYTLERPFEDDEMDVFRPELSTGGGETASSATPRPQRDPSATPDERVALNPARPPRPPVITNDGGGVALERPTGVAPLPSFSPVDNSSDEGDPWSLI